MVIQKPAINKKEFEIYDIIHETPDVDILKLKDEDGTKLNFDPGMFVMLTYTDPDKEKLEITRAFSIASAPNSEILEFYIHMIHGRFTSKLETAKKGDKIKVTGPYGQFKFIPSEDKKVIFVAGGTGIAPMMSMLRYIKNISADTDCLLIYSVRFPNEIIAKEELKELESSIKLKTVITVTRESDQPWDGEKGHINADMLRKYCQDCKDRTMYICGPLEFVKAMKSTAAEIGINNLKIKADVW